MEELNLGGGECIVRKKNGGSPRICAVPGAMDITIKSRKKSLGLIHDLV